MRIPHASTSGLLACLLSSTASIAHAADGQPTDWTPWQGHHYRVEADGQFACLSEDGRHCSIAAPGTVKAAPLRCDRLPKGNGTAGPNYEGNGHRRVGHWCNRAYANLFAEWKSYKPLGFDRQLATTPRGDVMCKSADGTTCSPADAPVAAPLIDPLVCGRVLKKRAGITGLEDPKHWCNSPEMLVHVADPLAYKSVERGTLARLSLRADHLNLADRPAWIVRLQTPEAPPDARFFGNVLSFRLLDAEPTRWLPDESRRSVRQMTSIQLGSSTQGANYVANSPMADVPVRREVQLDAQYRGTLAIRMNPDGSTTFYQAPGWPDDSLVDAFALKPTNGAVLKQPGADPAPWPVRSSVLEILGQGGNTWQDLGAEAGYVKEIIVVRKRPAPAR